MKFYRKFIPKIIKLCFYRLRIRLSSIVSPKEKTTFSSDGFTTTHFLGFRTDEKFNKAFSTAIKSLPEDGPKYLKSIEWRAHITTWAANQALNNEEGGDFVECGVWYGTLSKTICEYLNMENFGDRKFYLVDTFGETEGNHPYYKKDIYDDVKDRFAIYPQVKIIRGLVPGCLAKITSEKIGYLAIDMNSSEPELETLKYFYKKLVKGAIIYFDDYGWGYPELRKVVDEFFSDKPETLLHFPSGNSIVIKI